MTLRDTRLRVVFGAAAAVLVGTIAFTYWMGLLAVESHHKLAAEVSLLGHLDKFVSTMATAETGQRGYLLTGEELYLGPYREAVSLSKQEMATLHRLALSGDLPVEKVRAIRRLAEQKLAELEETIDVRRREGVEAAVGRMRTGRGQTLMGAIRTLASEMVAAEKEELKQATRRADRAGRVLRGTFISVAILNLEFLVWVYYLVAREMARRATAAQEVSRQQQLLSTTLASIGDAVIVTDPNCYVTFVNAEAERLTAWKSSESVGEPLSKMFRLVNEETGQAVENPVEKALRLGRAVSLEHYEMLVSKDARKTPIDDCAAPIRTPDGQLFGAVLVFRDFTEHQQAEALTAALNGIDLELHSSLRFEEIMQSAVSTAAAALGAETAAISLRRDDRWVVNYVHGLPKELVGAETNDDEMRHAVLAINTRAPVAIDDALNDERITSEHLVKWGIRSVLVVPLVTRTEAVGVMSFHYTRSAMTFRKVHLRFAAQLVSSIRMALENCRLVDTLEREVAERRRAESEAIAAREAVARVNSNLEAAIEERTAKLRETVADLEQFSYSLAHDLRAPLRTMCSFSTFVLEEHGRMLDDEGLDYLKRIASAALRMDQLIRDVLAYSQTVRIQPTLETVDLDRLVREIVDQYPQLKPVEAQVEIAGPLLPVKGHLALITQCVSNLLGNAVKFMSPGVKPKVRVWTEEHNGRVRVCVRDNGIGIEASQWERIWRIFERGHAGPEYAGTGIGLSIVKRAAEKMGGSVAVISELGKGSTFSFELAKGSAHVDRSVSTLQRVCA